MSLKRFAVGDLSENSSFDSAIYLDGKYILLSPETPLTADLISRLRRWGFHHILSEGDLKKAPALQATSQPDTTTSLLDTDIKEKQKTEEAQKLYYTLLNFTKDLYKQFREANKLNLAELTERIKDLIQSIKAGRDFILRFMQLHYPSENYLIQHSVNSTILALAIGDILKLPPHKLIELGISALLHELGMGKLPESIYTAERALTDEEKKMIKAHTVLGYRLLKSFSVSEDIALSALEHHERLDGSGYPQGLKGDKITLFAKILAVACSYDAIISLRPFKASADGHRAILDLLKNRQVHYDEGIIRALIYCLSLFPIGSLVLLANHSVARVVKTDPSSPKTPFVHLVIDENGNRPSEPVLLKTSPDKGLQILRGLRKEEIQSLNLV